MACFQEKQIEMEENYARQQDTASNFGNICVDPRSILKLLLCKNRLNLHSSVNEFLHEIAKLRLSPLQ